ncbi:MAG: hypothetical protein ACLGHN_08810 [Bacteriovoracia bacterium]
MKRSSILTLLLFVSTAHAGVSLHVEHPRNPSHAIDHYKIKCDAKCALEIQSPSPGKGSSSSELYQAKIKELLSMKSAGTLPETKVNARPVLYKIEASDGKNSINLVLAYPLSYEGEEYIKYVNVISVIEEVKRSMVLELMESKK